MDATFVYVLQVDVYASTYIEGVYATAKAAMDAHAPAPKGDGYSYEWMGPNPRGLYEFGAEWGDYAEIQRFEVRS